MEIAVIIISFLIVIIFGFLLGFRKRSRRENVFYGISILVSLITLMYNSSM